MASSATTSQQFLATARAIEQVAGSTDPASATVQSLAPPTSVILTMVNNGFSVPQTTMTLPDGTQLTPGGPGFPLGFHFSFNVQVQCFPGGPGLISHRVFANYSSAFGNVNTALVSDPCSGGGFGISNEIFNIGADQAGRYVLDLSGDSMSIHVHDTSPNELASLGESGSFELILQVGSVPQLALTKLTPDQTGTVTKTLATPLTVEVTDASGAPKSGIPIIFSLAGPSGASGQSLSTTATATDSNGIASTGLTLGNLTGNYQVTATCSQCAPPPVTFNAAAQLFLFVQAGQSAIAPVDFDQIVGPDNQVQLTLTAYGAGGKSDTIPGYPLTLISSVSANSGGHDHDGIRPDGNFSGSGLTINGSVAIGQTNSSGQLFVIFTSTYFSGTENFVAKSPIDFNVMAASMAVAVSVSGLTLLPDAASYSKVGGTCLHHGPGGPAGCDSPDQDHYGTAATNTSIAAAASAWLALYPDEPLLINDMSLPLGGGFDIDGNWSDDIVRKIPKILHAGCNPVGHCAHRLGKSVDILIKGIGSPDLLSSENQIALKEILLNAGSLEPYREGSHWHVEFSH